MTAGVLDTSVFIAAESGRALDHSALPDEGYLTVVTLAELEAGVLAAKTTEQRAARLRTLQSLVGVEHLPITADAAHEWARLRFRLAEAGRRANVNDLWIASVALSLGLPVVTQDADFDVLAPLGGPGIVRV
jgi:predicted nucleic acid-binding protein